MESRGGGGFYCEKSLLCFEVINIYKMKLCMFYFFYVYYFIVLINFLKVIFWREEGEN